jgi:hypothetical protein
MPAAELLKPVAHETLIEGFTVPEVINPLHPHHPFPKPLVIP